MSYGALVHPCHGHLVSGPFANLNVRVSTCPDTFAPAFDCWRFCIAQVQAHAGTAAAGDRCHLAADAADCSPLLAGYAEEAAGNASDWDSDQENDGKPPETYSLGVTDRRRRYWAPSFAFLQFHLYYRVLRCMYMLPKSILALDSQDPDKEEIGCEHSAQSLYRYQKRVLHFPGLDF